MPAEASRYDAFVHRCLAGLLSPSIAARRAEAVGAIMACLAHMTEDYRRVLQRLHLDQAEVAEVAAEMGRTPDAVRRLAGRALEALRTELGNASRYFESRG
jgi:DNA-directed RNA polymerase specialized sigma24 family protein